MISFSRRPIIQSGYTSYPPGYPILHVDALNTELSKCARAKDVDPVIYVGPGIGDLRGSACCHVEVGGMRILASVSRDVDPLVAFAFLQAFVDVLVDYFGTVNAATLKDNFDTVYQLLEETLDSSGHPLTTSPNALRDIVLPPSLITKLIASIAPSGPSPASGRPGAGSLAGAGAGTAFASPIPWRKAGVRHNHNEILFDVVEDMCATIGRNGATLSSLVWGKIDCNAKLSGTPDLTMTFVNPTVMTNCAFHPCVRLQRWSRDKVFSFVPPDGQFVIAEYQYGPPHGALSGNVPVPIAFKANVTTDENEGSFTLTISSKLSTKPMENVIIEHYLGEDSTGAQCSTSSSGTGLGTVGGAEGSWMYDHHKHVLRWEIPNLTTSGSWSLRGSWSSKSKTPRPDRTYAIKFDIPSYTFSALKVDQLRLSSEAYKMYKGVRGRSKGSIEWRW